MSTTAFADCDILPLLSLIKASQATRLAGSALGGLLPGEKVADLFCGAGGWGEGAREHGIAVDFAVNHSPVAIAAHKANNPRCKHHQGDAWKARPRQVIGEGTVLGLLLASAACTTHSRAKGSAPISKRVHMLGWCIARWMREVSPRVVLIENVPEWKDWGPLVDKLDERGRVVLDKGGRPVRVQCPRRKGQHFRRWWRQCERLGYAMEMRVLDAKDYGAASTRKRLFIVARRDGAPICWPEKTHGKAVLVGDGGPQRERHEGLDRSGAQQSVPRWLEDGGVRAESRGPGGDGVSDAAKGEGGVKGGRRVRVSGASAAGEDRRRPYRTAAECIDWSNLGRSIFDRNKPLAPKTLERIAAGIERYVINDPSPFVFRVTQTGGDGVGGSIRPVDEAMPTQTTRQDFAVATPVMVRDGFAERPGQHPRSGRADEPLNTVMSGRVTAGVATPVVQVIRGDVKGRRADDPLPTITAGNGPGRGAGAAHALAISTPVLAYLRRNTNATAADAPMHTQCANATHAALVAPIVAPQNTGRFGHPADEPGQTIMTAGHQALIAPLLMQQNHGEKPCQSVRESLRTLTTQGNRHNLIAPVLVGAGGSGYAAKPTSADRPLNTVKCDDRRGLVAAFMVQYYGSGGQWSRPDAPLGAVVTNDRHALVVVHIDGEPYVIVDVLFRMLTPAELARAMGFRDDYAWPATKRDTVKLIGNAVAPPMAAALIGAVLPGGRKKGRAVA